MTDEFVPIALFIVAGLAYAVRQYFRFRTAREQQATVREVVARGSEISPEVLESVLEGLLPSPQADLRRGVIGVAIGLGVAVFAIVLGEPDAQRPLLGLAIFPVLIGAAYVALWWFNRHES